MNNNYQDDFVLELVNAARAIALYRGAVEKNVNDGLQRSYLDSNLCIRYQPNAWVWVAVKVTPTEELRPVEGMEGWFVALYAPCSKKADSGYECSSPSINLLNDSSQSWASCLLELYEYTLSDSTIWTNAQFLSRAAQSSVASAQQSIKELRSLSEMGVKGASWALRLLHFLTLLSPRERANLVEVIRQSLGGQDGSKSE